MSYPIKCPLPARVAAENVIIINGDDDHVDDDNDGGDSGDDKLFEDGQVQSDEIARVN